MKDPEEAHDTDPTAGPIVGAEESPSDETSATHDTSPDGFAGGEPDTDDFLRWLPTLALGHRRRTELIERPSSDGADFAAYACTARPAAASVRPQTEATMPVQTPGDDSGSEGLQRDAPTVLTRARTRRRSRRRIALGAAGLAAAAMGLAGLWRIAAGRAAARDEALLTPGPPTVHAPAPPTEPAESRSPLARANEIPQAFSPPAARVRLRALGSNSPTSAARSREVAHAPPARPAARGRAAPSAAASAAKDQYFEVP